VVLSGAFMAVVLFPSLVFADFSYTPTDTQSPSTSSLGASGFWYIPLGYGWSGRMATTTTYMENITGTAFALSTFQYKQCDVEFVPTSISGTNCPSGAQLLTSLSFGQMPVSGADPYTNASYTYTADANPAKFTYLAFNVSFQTKDFQMYGSQDDFFRYGGIQNVGTADDLSPLVTPYLIIESVTAPVSLERTRIISLDPPDESTVSTSTPVTATTTGYISSEDFEEEGTYVVFVLKPLITPFLGTGYAGDQTATVEITSSGFFTATTTFETLSEGAGYPVGEYELYAYLWVCNPVFGFCGIKSYLIPLDPYAGPTELVNDLIVGTSTQVGQDFKNQVQVLRDLLGAPSTGTTTPMVSSYCNPLGDFQFVNCLFGLFSFGASIVNEPIQSFLSNLTSRAPWGYAKRLIVILQGNATTTLPSIAFTVPSGFPVGEGKTFDFTPWEPIQAGVTMIDEARPYGITESPMETFLYWWNLLWGIMFGLWLLREIYGAWTSGDFEDLGFVGDGAHGRIRKDVRGRKYQEYSTGDVKRLLKKGENSGFNK